MGAAGLESLGVVFRAVPIGLAHRRPASPLAGLANTPVPSTARVRGVAASPPVASAYAAGAPPGSFSALLIRGPAALPVSSKGTSRTSCGPLRPSSWPSPHRPPRRSGPPLWAPEPPPAKISRPAANVRAAVDSPGSSPRSSGARGAAAVTVSSGVAPGAVAGPPAAPGSTAPRSLADPPRAGSMLLSGAAEPA